MPDSIRQRRRPDRDATLTAAAQLIDPYSQTQRQLITETPAGRELWEMYDVIGEFAAFVDWMGRAMSRVRLTAAEQMPGGDEPAPVTSGPVSELVSAWYGGTAGQAEFMQLITPHLMVPGEAWVLPERFDRTVPLTMVDWSVQSTETFRSRGGGTLEVQTENGVWRQLMPEALPVRIWMPDPKRPFIARSPALAALPIMRRLVLIDKRLVAEMLSRLVMNGIMWIPSEASIPVSEKNKGKPNGFMADLLDVAATNIGNPGNASAAIPIPTRFPGDWIEKIRHDKFVEPMDEQLLAERDRELSRLAKSLPLSTERQEGFASSNHWNGFIVNEDDLKTSIAPVAETITRGITVGFLYPMLAAAGLPMLGENGGRLLVWPDFSDLVSKPDKSANTVLAYDRGEASGMALRRESGLDEADRPDPAEQREMILLKLARDPGAFASAFQLLTGTEVPVQTPTVGGQAPIGPDADSSSPPRAEPGSAPPPTVGQAPAPAAPPAVVASGAQIVEMGTRRPTAAGRGR